MIPRYDVVIVGAGPGGAMAACVLGQAGCRTLVLERQTLPRHKPCGGAIPSPVFDRLPAACAEAVEREVRRVRFLLPQRGEAAHDLPGRPIAMVMRDRFDSLLLAQAPATVHDGEGAVGLDDGPHGAVVRTTRGERYRADYVIGADGASSLVARQVGLRAGHVVATALEAEVPADSASLARHADTALFYFGIVADGYLWVFPKRDHLSLGVGCLRGGGRGLRRRLYEAAARLGLPAQAVRPRGHPLPVYRRPERLQRGRVLLVGDAAGLVDPLSGEGIRHALTSARLAAQAILAGDLAGYSRRVYQEIGRDLGAALWLARLFYGCTTLSFRLGARDRLTVIALLRVLAGEMSYRGLLARVPGYWLRRLFSRHE